MMRLQSKQTGLNSRADKARRLVIHKRLFMVLMASSLCLTASLSRADTRLQPRTLAAAHFRLTFPNTLRERDARRVLELLEGVRADLLRRSGNAGVSVPFPTIDLFLNESTGDFVGRTGQPWWAAAATNGHRIELQPLALLRRRAILESTLRHELAHILIEAASHERAPRWLAEGFAIYLAGEGPRLARQTSPANLTTAEIESLLAGAASPQQMQSAYAAAYREVNKIIQQQGEAGVWKRIVQR
jgi:hypothetical protein